MKVLKDLAVSGQITVGQLLQSSIDTDKFIVSDGGVAKFRTGSQLLGDIDGVINTRTITINGTAQDLTANRSFTVGDVRTDGSYANPAWITSLAWSKITGAPAFLTAEADTLASVTGRGNTTSVGATFGTAANALYTGPSGFIRINTNTNNPADGRNAQSTNLLLANYGGDLGVDGTVDIDFVTVDGNSVVGSQPQVRIGYTGAYNDLVNSSPDGEARGYFRIATRGEGSSGVLADRLLIDHIGTLRLLNYTTNGFLKFSNSNGTVTVDTNTYATQSWVQSQGYLTSVSDVWVNNSGDSMTGNLSFGSSGAGLTWAANTDGASITFESTGDGGSGGRALSNLLIALSDNGDEGLKVTSASAELLYVNTNQFQYKGNTIWHAGNDGTGSGLDANLLDGVSSASFLRSDVVDANLTGTILSTNNANIDGANFEVNTTNKTVNEYAYKVSRSGSAVGGIFIDGRGAFASGTTVNGSTVWHQGNLTNLNQLSNGPGYITSNQTITLTGNVTGSGTTSIATTIANGVVTNTMLVNSSFFIGTTSISLGRASAAQNLTGVSIDGTAKHLLNNYIATDANLIWQSGVYSFFNGTNVPGGDFGMISIPTWGSTDSSNRYNLQIGSNIGGNPVFRTTNINGAGTWYTFWHSGNLTNLNQLTNGPGYITSYTETDTLATVTGRGASTNTFVSLLGGSRIVVQNSTDGGNNRGIFMWNTSDTNWGIYMSTAGASKSLANGTAPTGIDGSNSHHIRFRIAGSSGNGFIWENNSEQTLMSVRGDNGNLYVRGQIYAGNSTTNQVWHSGNLTNLNQLTNGPGYITSYTETDTFQSVVSRGSSASTGSAQGVTITHTYNQTNLHHNTLWLKANNSGANLGASIGFTVVNAAGDHHRANVLVTGNTGNVGGQFAIYTRSTGGTDVRGYYQNEAGNVRFDNYIGVGQDPNTSYRIIADGSLYLNSNGNGWAEGVWKQRRGGGTFYDVIDAGNIGSQSVSYAASAGSLSNVNISQFTNNSGYITSTNTDFTYSASLTLSTSWQNTGVTSANLGTSGVYIVTCFANDYAVSGAQYSCTYAGVMYWYAGGTNSVDTISEIQLHHSGHHDGGRFIFLRTLSTLGAGDGKTYLQIRGNGNNSGASTYSLTFKRLL
jgi:hypothetical protein